MRSSLVSDAAMLVLLGWIERGYATLAAAEGGGRIRNRTDKPSWAKALNSGYFTIERSGGLKLTQAGKDWMADLRRAG